MTEQTVSFVHSTTPPPSDVTVYSTLSRDFLGSTFTFRVIGSSHYVSAPAYGFHELATCDGVAVDNTATFRLNRQWESRTLTHENDRVECETTVVRRPLAAFPRDRSFDLAYWFETDAVTAIDLRPVGFETYHTYPEFDLTVYSQTVFRRVDGRPLEHPVASETDPAADGQSQTQTE